MRAHARLADRHQVQPVAPVALARRAPRSAVIALEKALDAVLCAPELRIFDAGPSAGVRSCASGRSLRESGNAIRAAAAVHRAHAHAICRENSWKRWPGLGGVYPRTLAASNGSLASVLRAKSAKAQATLMTSSLCGGVRFGGMSRVLSPASMS